MRSRFIVALAFLSVFQCFSAQARTPRPRASASVKAPTGAQRDPAVQRWLRGMSLRDKVGQLVMVHSYGEAPSVRSKDWKKFVHYVRDLRVGGVVVVNRVVSGAVRNAEPHAMAAFLNRLQRMSKVPLIAGADFERGASMRVAGTAKFPHLMAYGAANDASLTRQLGAATAKEARALGVQWVFAPVADVNNNPDNPIINIRSFGEDPRLVAAHVKAFIEGAHSDPKHRVLVTAKHFPGHGDTATDSHMGLPVITATKERLDGTELVPFRAAVEAGVDSIMSAHISVPAIDPEGAPATASAKILAGLIRDELGFKGLVVTDAMDMAGLTKQYPGGEAAVRALEAGADVLLMPPDPDAAVKGVLAAVKSGRLTEKRINESVVRLLSAKVKVGLNRKALVDVEAVSDTLESEEFQESAQRAADRAVTLVKNEDAAFPVKPGACWWILAEGRYGQGGRRMLEEVRARDKSARATPLDTMVPPVEMDDLLAKGSGCATHVVAAYVSVGAYRGNVALGGSYPYLMEKLLAGSAPVVMVSMGNPYLLSSFPKVRAYVATFSPAPTSEVAAVRALLGEIPVTGTSPAGDLTR